MGVTIQIRVSEQERDAWKAEADSLGLSMSGYLHMRLIQACSPIAQNRPSKPSEQPKAVSTPKPAAKPVDANLCSDCQRRPTPDPACYKCWLKNRT